MAKLYNILSNLSYRSGSKDEEYTAAKVWLKDKSFGPFINGKMILKGDSKVHHVMDPWTNSPLTTVRTASSEDIDRAIANAIGAHCVLHKFDDEKVLKFMLEIAGNLEKYAQLFSQVDSLNRGVLVSTPRQFDVPAMSNSFKYHANAAYDASNERDTAVMEPMTVGIMTKDTPLIALAWLLAPAFALRSVVCLVVPKETALPAMLFAQICIEASGFDGIFNILPGDEATVDYTVSHSSVSNVRFFGPTSVARHLKQITAGECKITTALMTGKSQMLVFDTADLAAAVDCAVKSAWHYQGVVPWSVKTLIVQESIFEEFVKLLKSQLESLRFGPPYSKKADIGPSCRGDTIDAIADVVKAARAAGIQVFQGALFADLSPDRYIPPTVLIGGDLDFNGVGAKIVGLPVISVVPFRTAKEAVALANNARYSLATSIWSENLSLSLTVADNLNVGTVWINTHGVFDPAVPFGGWKESGVGSFGGYSGYQNSLMKTKFSTEKSVAPILEPSGPSGKEYKLYYSGAYYASKTNKPIEIEKDGKPFAKIALTCSNDMNMAVQCAVSAQERWHLVNPLVRALTMHKMAGRLHFERKRLGSLCTNAEDFYAIADCLIHEIHLWATTCAKDVSSFVRPCAANVTVRVSKEPLGLIGISPRENDLVSLMTTVTAAVCYGNAALVLLDPALALPTLEIFKAILDVVPSGLINIMTGDVPAMMEMLSRHPDVGGIWFPDCSPEMAATIEQNSVVDMKRIYVDCGVLFNRLFFEQRLTQLKAVWMSKGCGLC